MFNEFLGNYNRARVFEAGRGSIQPVWTSLNLPREKINTQEGCYQTWKRIADIALVEQEDNVPSCFTLNTCLITRQVFLFMAFTELQGNFKILQIDQSWLSCDRFVLWYMLNRKKPRVKVMQKPFAYQQCKDANYTLATDAIEEAFAPRSQLDGSTG